MVPFKVVSKYSRYRRARLRNQDPIFELIDSISRLGFTVQMPDFNWGTWAYGWCEQKEKRIIVFLRMQNGRVWSDADICFLLAHEYMHALHQKNGLFRKYYDERYKKRPDLFLTALAAERHCDKFARDYINEHYPKDRFKSLLRNRTYPAWRVNPKYLPDKPRYERWMVDLYYNYKKQAKESKTHEAKALMRRIMRSDFGKGTVERIFAQQGVEGLIHG